MRTVKNRADEPGDVKLAEELVFNPCGLMLDPIKTGAGKTPDFRVITWHGLVGSCEIKSPRNDDLDNMLFDELEENPDVPVVRAFLARTDPLPKRLGRQVRDAFDQFDAVNSDHSVPNILLFVNHARGVSADRLLETLTGYFYSDSGEVYANATRVAGRLVVKRDWIDLYIWLDRHGRQKPQLFFANVDKNHHRILRNSFCALR